MRKKCSKVILALFLFCLMCFVSSSAAAQHRYAVTDLGTLGGSQSFAYAINDYGKIVGYSWIAGDAEGHPFLRSNGKMIDLYPLMGDSIPQSINNSGQIASGAVVDGIYYPALFDSLTGEITILGSLGGMTSFGFNGVAASINNVGQAVGYSHLDSLNRHAFLYDSGVMTDIGSFGGYSGALAINDRGMIVGFASDRYNGRAHAFLHTDSMMIDLDPFGDSDFSWAESYARGINNRGQVVGEFLTEDETAFHAFLYSEGVFTDLGSADSPETVPFSINDPGQVVGTTLIPYDDLCWDFDLQEYVPCIKYKEHAFLYENGVMTDLNTLIPPNSGWELSWAFDINNKGRIVGYGLVNEVFRAYLLTPITEVAIRINPWLANFIWLLPKIGYMPVGIVSTRDFDATRLVKQDSLTFGRTGDEHSLAFCGRWPAFVNKDGFRDLVCYFYKRTSGFKCGDTEGILKGKTVGGTPIEGKASVKIIPCR